MLKHHDVRSKLRCLPTDDSYYLANTNCLSNVATEPAFGELPSCETSVVKKGRIDKDKSRRKHHDSRRTFNVLGHCGYEISPNRFLHNRLGLVLNSATHHSLHHEMFNANFALNFNLWDRLMATNCADYESQFDEATQFKSKNSF